MTQQRFGDLIAYFNLTEKHCYHSMAFFHALIFELDEFVDYHQIMTELARVVRAKVGKPAAESLQPPAGGAFLPVSNAQYQSLHTQNNANSANAGPGTISNEAVGQSTQLNELKTVIRFQYKLILEHLASCTASRVPAELSVVLMDSQFSLQCTIQHQTASDMSTYYRLRYIEDDVSRLE